MSQLSLNGVPVGAKQIVPLRAELQKPDGIAEASRKTQRNGIDEVYFQQDGTHFVAYGRGMDLPKLGENQAPAVLFNDRPATFAMAEDEVNGLGERMGRGAVKGAKLLGITIGIASAIPAAVYQKALTNASTRGSILTVVGVAGLVGLAAGTVGALGGAGIGALPIGKQDWKSIQAVTGQTP